MNGRSSKILCYTPLIAALAIFTASAVYTFRLAADSVPLKDGRVLEGRMAKVPGVAIDPLNASAKSRGPVDVMLVWMIDNELTRTMIPKAQIRDVPTPSTVPLERIKISQPVATSGPRVASVGPIVNITEFDEFGRRIFSMNTTQGQVDVIQGITEITPVWTKVEGLKGEKPYIWDMRIATSSIPRATLSRILHKRIDPKNRDHRLRIVRLYLQSERYQDARDELDQVIKDFPNLKELAAEVQAISQLSARTLLREIETRRKAGQHRFAYQLLEQFPSEHVADETLVQVRERVDEYKASYQHSTEMLAGLKGHLEAIENSRLREQLTPMCQEIIRDVFYNTLDRLATYERLSDDNNLRPEQKVSLAISGWLLGANDATENTIMAVSLVQTRALLEEYMNAATPDERDEVVEKLRSQEAFEPDLVAKMFAHMKPPLRTEPQNQQGLYELQVPGLDGEPDVTYYVQLPPEYDPHRPYPAVVTLSGVSTTPQLQIDWWAGAQLPSGQRMGQASRHGYVVIAPVWATPHQKECKYTAREHAAVLNALRDACRRFSIDTDRVFLSGHSMGGDAAWDIGLAHPDLWAGVIPIVATTGNVIPHYWPNASNLPFYFVGGELDGGKLVENSRDLDRYLNKGYDVTVVEYLGRGHEHFSDEILKIFDWMERKERVFFTREFTAATMRPWDNFFWWIEVRQFPPKAVTANWPPPAGTLPLSLKGTITQNNGINVRAGSGKVTVWLSPEMVDFDKPMSITVNGRRVASGRSAVKPDILILLEDVRTRGDRQHPFWAKVE